MTAKIVLRDDLAHIGEDLVGGRDRRPDRWLEAVAKGVKIAVGTDAGITMRAPGAAKTLLAFQNHEALVWQVLVELIGAADAGNAGADDQDIEMLDGLRSVGFTDGCHDVHGRR